MRQEIRFSNESRIGGSGFLKGYNLSNLGSDPCLDRPAQKMWQSGRAWPAESGLVGSERKLSHFVGPESPLSLQDSLGFRRKANGSNHYLAEPDPNVFERFRQAEEENLRLKKQLSLGGRAAEDCGPDGASLETKICDLKAALLILEAENAYLLMENFELREGRLGSSEISTIDYSPPSMKKIFDSNSLGHSRPEPLSQTPIYKQKLDFAVRKRNLELNYLELKKGLADNETLSDLELFRFRIPQLELQLSELAKEKSRLERRIRNLRQR